MLTKEELLKTVRNLEKEHRSEVSELRKKYRDIRISLCLENGGHFWWPEALRPDPRVLEPHRYSYFRMCEVCRKDVFVRLELEEDGV